MNLNEHHIMELALIDYYTDRFKGAAVSVMALNECDSELIHEGLVHIEGEGEIRNLSVTKRGKRALEEIGAGAVVESLYSLGRVELLHLCEGKVALGDLPLLFASQNVAVREFAEKKYKELV